MIEFKKYSIWKKKDERILITFVYRNNDIQCKNYNDFKKNDENNNKKIDDKKFDFCHYYN